MNFLVFIKQVPDVTEELRFHPETKTLAREGIRSVINPYDRRAISEAVRFRKESGGKVTVCTMGPAQARDALREALLMGADEAVHILDSQLAGSDTLVTARVLARAAQLLGFDIVLCGEHSTDSETGQVPPETAELLGIPFAPAVRKIEYGHSGIRVHSESDEGILVLDLDLPALLSSAERLIKPIKVKDLELSLADDRPYRILSLDDLQIESSEVGLQGSPTLVADVLQMKTSRSPRIVDGSDPNLAAQEILKTLDATGRDRERKPVPENHKPEGREFWCWTEMIGDAIRPASLDILAEAAILARESGGVVCALLSQPVEEELNQLLAAWGADKIYVTESDVRHPDLLVSLLAANIENLKPFAFFAPSTAAARMVVPRIAARLQLGLTGDCVGLHWDEQGKLVHLKPAYGGNIVAPIYSRTFPQMATIRPGALGPFLPRSAAPIPVIRWNTMLVRSPSSFHIVESIQDSGVAATRMETAPIVICIGMGLGQENIPLATQLADFIGGAIGATRRVVDAGWLPRQFQVGLTGKFIAPEMYLGLGVSGRYNHTIGIQKAGKIVAVNHDPNAEIFRNADLGVIGDCVTVSRQLIELLKQKQAR